VTGFGALSPLPLRLGGDGEIGWTAAQYVSACSDTLACLRASPLARVRVESGAIVAYRGLNGCGLTHAPTITDGGFFQELTWPASYEDDAGEMHIIGIQTAQTTAVGAVVGGLIPLIWKNNIVYVYTYDDFVLTVWSSGYERKLSDYEAYTDKENTKSEVVPYAWSSYQALQDARGSAYSKERSGLLHIENLVLARGHAARWRDAERISCNANPATATEKQADWQEVLDVSPRYGESPEDIRARLAAKFQLSLGPTQQAVNDAIQGLLGSFFVRVWREHGGDLSDPPDVTYWPSANDGPPAFDLGGGTWSSERSRLFIEVTPIAEADLATFNAKIDQLAELLDRVLPAWMTWDWGTVADTGFILDEDILDEASMGSA
jgi:hypothetical protein